MVAMITIGPCTVCTLDPNAETVVDEVDALMALVFANLTGKVSYNHRF